MLSQRTMRPSGAGAQGDQTTHPPASLCFSFNKTQSAAARRLMHSGGAFIYSRYRYLRSSPFVFKCLQMSSALSPPPPSCRFTDSLPTRPPPRSLQPPPPTPPPHPPRLRDLINMHDLRCQLSTLEWFFRKRYPPSS